MGGKSNPPPLEYTELTLCRLYGCTPSQLWGEDVRAMMVHLTLVQAEEKYAQEQRGEFIVEADDEGAVDAILTG